MSDGGAIRGSQVVVMRETVDVFSGASAGSRTRINGFGDRFIDVQYQYVMKYGMTR
ncbi:hypothetical protein OpiT1DRAFT_05310 [Opitutaceae bacterium TAV1]|nr:hypothetical protein OpiT1DRAFT_05310 [Opitutaceae bacterium TAV1]